MQGADILLAHNFILSLLIIYEEKSFHCLPNAAATSVHIILSETVKLLSLRCTTETAITAKRLQQLFLE